MPPSGGSVTTDTDGGGASAGDPQEVTVNVPSGALNQTTTLTIKEVDANDPALPPPPDGSLANAFVFEPDGQQFNSPVTLVFFYLDGNNDGFEDTTGINESTLQVNLLLSGSYVVLPPCPPPTAGNPCELSRDTTANSITVQTSHFSTYVVEGQLPATATPTPSPSPSPTPLFHDASIKRVGSPHSVHLHPGIPDTSGPLTVVVANNLSNHLDSVGVYLALLPPGGTSNPGSCSPATVLNLGVFSLMPLEKITVKIDPAWQCLNPAVVNGMNWTLKAIADIHADDFSSCATLSQAFDVGCSTAISNDDDADANNTKTRALPVVVALP